MPTGHGRHFRGHREFARARRTRCPQDAERGLRVPSCQSLRIRTIECRSDMSASGVTGSKVQANAKRLVFLTAGSSLTNIWRRAAKNAEPADLHARRKATTSPAPGSALPNVRACGEAARGLRCWAWPRSTDGGGIDNALSAMEGFEVPLAAWRVHASAAELETRRGNQRAACRHRSLGGATALALANSLVDHERLRATFLAAPEVRAIVDLSRLP